MKRKRTSDTTIPKDSKRNCSSSRLISDTKKIRRLIICLECGEYLVTSDEQNISRDHVCEGIDQNKTRQCIDILTQVLPASPSGPPGPPPPPPPPPPPTPLLMTSVPPFGKKTESKSEKVQVEPTGSQSLMIMELQNRFKYV